MDRESEEHEEPTVMYMRRLIMSQIQQKRSDRELEELNRANREQSENGGESEEESEVDPHLLLRRINEQLSQQREEGNGATELKFDDLRRLYELNNNNSSSNNNNSNNCNSANNGSSSNSNNSSSNNGHATHIPEAHRPPSGSAGLTGGSPFSAFTQQFPSDRDRLMQFHLSNYLNNPTYQQQFGSNSAIPNLSGLTSSIMQPGTSFQSLPGSRIPSPHSQPFQRKQNSSPPPFGRSSPSFQSPPPAHVKRSASVSSRHSREDESSSPVHQTTWSFEEQFKQLYDIDRNDVKRKEFLDDLFSFMQKHETPVTRLPIMAKSVLDLYELYKLVVQRGGLVDVINKKLWQEVIKGLNLPSSITSAAFTLRTQYMKFLYAYECHKMNLSSRQELETAIEGNKREGRRTSYYGDLQMRSPTSNSANNGPHSNNSMHHHGSSRISPISMVTTSTPNSIGNRIQINGHSNQFPNHVGDAQIPNVPGLVIPGAPVQLPTDPRLIEYFKHIGRISNPSMGNGTGSSPDMQDPSNFNNLEMNIALWNSIYNGVVKTPLPSTQMLPFAQLTRPRSPDSNNDAPLDLGKNRKTDSDSGEEMRAVKCKREREADESEESESESDEDAELLLPTNSSQASRNAEMVTPLPIQIKINGIKYRGVLHPKRRKIQ